MVRAFSCMFAGIVLLAALAASFSHAAGNGKIIVGGEHQFPPYEFLENGEPTGFNVELMQAVAEIVGLDIEIRLGPWSEVRKNLEEGKIDVVTGMAYSKDREKRMLFTIPHTMITPALFVRNDSPIQRYNDIFGKEIIVQKDDIMHDFLQKRQIASRIITAPTYSEALKKLSSGKHDAVLMSSKIHKYYILGKFDFKNLREVKNELPPQNYCFAVAKGNQALLHKLDRGLITLKATGKYTELHNKWFTIYEKKKWWETGKYFVYALMLIGSSFAASLLWSWSLKKRVEEQTAELRIAHAEQEQRVKERTADLAEANRQLADEVEERRRIEKALRYSEAKYRAIVEAFDGQIYICSSDYKIEFMNPQLIQRTGRDATGEKCYSVLHDLDEICPWCINDRVQKGETVRWEVQSPKDNRWYYVVNTPLHNVHGTISKLAMILDITERVEADLAKRRLEENKRRLKKVESLDRMAGAIAHHFNNKLHVVIGNLELVRIDMHDEQSKAAKYLQEAIQSAHKAVEVSHLMLTYLGKVSGGKETLDLAEVCRRSLPQIQANMPENVILETDILSTGLVIRGNANHIQMILNNMIKNGWEAIGERKGVVHLCVKKALVADITLPYKFPVDWQPENVEYGCIEVRDNGCGIAEKDIEATFDPFYSTKFTGRGLGLSVVLGLVQMHDGVATVESVLDQGSVFRIFMPLSDERVEDRKGKPAPVPILQGEGSVLLVDDDAIVLSINSEMLSMLGYTVLPAHDGYEAIALYQQHKDDIRFVLTDFAMPKMNGLELLAALQGFDPELPVIIASGYSEEQVMDSWKQPQQFLEKPFGLQELTEALSIALSQRSARAENKVETGRNSKNEK